MSLRVGVFVDRYEPSRGGLESALTRLVRHLLDRDHRVEVYGLRAAAGAPGVFHVVDVSRLPRGELERELAARSLAAARADGCDVTLAVRHAPEVDVYWPHGGAHAATLAAGERARGSLSGGVSRVLHRLSPRHRVFLELERAALSGGARRVWCVSEMIRDELTAEHPGCAERLEVHPNGVDRERYSPALRERHRDAVRARWAVPADSLVVLFPGGERKLKGRHVLRAALARLAATARVPSWTCIALDAEGDDLGGRLHGVPWQPMTEALGAADVVVQPTFRDPCSLATLETLAAGVPVVTTDANGAAACVDESCGAVTPPGDVDATTSALAAWLRIVAAADRRRAASESARAATEGRGALDWLDGLERSLRSVASGGDQSSLH